MKQATLPNNAIWLIINDPKFLEKCKVHDPCLIAKLNSLSKLEPAELGKLAHEAYERSTDQRVGKFNRVLSAEMTELAVGESLQVLFSHCTLRRSVEQK